MKQKKLSTIGETEDISSLRLRFAQRETELLFEIE